MSQENELKSKLQKQREILTEYSKESENLDLSIKGAQKEVKDLRSQKKDVLESIKKTLGEVYALENAIKMGEK